jgi:hypothetical protein
MKSLKSFGILALLGLTAPHSAAHADKANSEVAHTGICHATSASLATRLSRASGSLRNISHNTVSVTCPVARDASAESNVWLGITVASHVDTGHKYATGVACRFDSAGGAPRKTVTKWASTSSTAPTTISARFDEAELFTHGALDITCALPAGAEVFSVMTVGMDEVVESE